MMINTIQQVETLNATIRKVDEEIVKRLKAIRRNVAPNAAIARNHVRTLQRENEQRKAILHLNRTRIEQLYEADGGRYSKMRRTFLTPDGPKEKGNRGRPMVSIEEMNRVKKSRVPLLPPTAIKPSPPTKKQRKRVSPPPKDIEVRPLPIVTPAKPPARLNEAADSVRQGAHRMAADRAKAIRKVQDAKRDTELVRKGQMNLVRRRRSRELAKRRQEIRQRNIRMRNQRVEEIKRKAVNAERTARAQANTIATRNVAVSPRRPTPSRGPVRPNGLVPQLALMTALNDKNRAAKVNQATRTQEVVPQGPIADQITEDVRKAAPVKPIRSKEYYNFVRLVSSEHLNFHKAIEAFKAGKFPRGSPLENFDFSLLSKDQIEYWARRAYAVSNQVKKIALDEAVRWDQGLLSAGVNISTDARSQSRRKMTLQEFKTYLMGKIRPIIEPVMNEFMEALKRASAGSTDSSPSSTKSSSSSSSSNHQAEVQELLRDKPHFEEQYAQWWYRQRQKPWPSSVTYRELLNDKPTMDEIARYSADARKARAIFERKFTNQEPTGRDNQPLTLPQAKLLIEDTYLFLLIGAHAAVQRFVGKHDLTYAPMPQERQDEIGAPPGKYGGRRQNLNGLTRNITMHPRTQRTLSGIDKLRGHGRPVLSEQQGTKGLAGLFPALRSSMQGALRQ